MMSDAKSAVLDAPPWRNVEVPEPAKAVFRGIGQVFFQEHAISGVCFVVGIALSSPLVAAGVLADSAIGTAVAWPSRFDRSEILAGIYGFNSCLVGAAAFFFFRPVPTTFVLMIAGCVAAAWVTHLMRRHVPFPTYTTPFIVTAWGLFFLGRSLGIAPTEPGASINTSSLAVAATHGIGQVIFQANVWTGRLFLIGIAVSNMRHAAWVLAGTALGTLLASYHVSAGARALDPERLVERALTENIALGLYGYNATLTAVALSLGRRSLIAPLLGIVISVPLTESFPMTGLPALTAPFVLSTWIVLALAWLEAKYPLPRPAPGS